MLTAKTARFQVKMKRLTYKRLEIHGNAANSEISVFIGNLVVHFVDIVVCIILNEANCSILLFREYFDLVDISIFLNVIKPKKTYLKSFINVVLGDIRRELLREDARRLKECTKPTFLQASSFPRPFLEKE